MTRKPSAAQCAPLTPDFISGTETLEAVQKQRIAELAADNQRLREDTDSLRQLLAAERRRHAKLETALSRYQSVLEKQINAQETQTAGLRKALVEALGSALIPHSSERN